MDQSEGNLLRDQNSFGMNRNYSDRFPRYKISSLMRIFSQTCCMYSLSKCCLKGRLKKERGDLSYADDKLTKILDTRTIVR